jgi:hypothetical protein
MDVQIKGTLASSIPTISDDNSRNDTPRCLSRSLILGIQSRIAQVENQSADQSRVETSRYMDKGQTIEAVAFIGPE